MNGQIFISYRRNAGTKSAGHLYDWLSAYFPKNKVLNGFGLLAAGDNLVKSIEKKVSGCDVLIAVIGLDWLASQDVQGGWQIDDPNDFVRLEIAAALNRNIRVIPVLVDGALMPVLSELPDDVQTLVSRDAFRVSDMGFEDDCRSLAAAIEQSLENNTAERRQREERERLAAERRQREEQERRDEQAERYEEANRRQRQEQKRLEPGQPKRKPPVTKYPASAPEPPLPIDRHPQSSMKRRLGPFQVLRDCVDRAAEFMLKTPKPWVHQRLEAERGDADDLIKSLGSRKIPQKPEHRPINTREAERNPVDCTVFAPDRVERKQSALLQVFLHAPHERQQAEEEAEKFDPETKERGHKSLVLDAPVGTTFAFVVEIEGFEFHERTDTLLWTGKPQAATFVFEVPKGCKWGQHTGTVRISKDGLPVGKISFQIEVVRDAADARRQPVGKEARHYHACFCSYSAPDRAEMLKRAQGVRAAGLETFIDVMTLRPGDLWDPEIFAAIDRSDLFVVIWSKNARDSEWVKKESRYALKLCEERGSPDFVPIPVEGPPIASVPRGLRARHFNDELLHLIRAEELKLERRESEKAKFGQEPKS